MTRKTPPRRPMSSPISTTRSSSRIASSAAGAPVVAAAVEADASFLLALRRAHAFARPTAAVARRHLEAAGVLSRVELRLGGARAPK